MHQLVYVSILLCIVSGHCLGQSSRRGVWIGFAQKDGRMTGAPDPTNATHLYQVLQCPEFALELEISPDQRREIDKIIIKVPAPSDEFIEASPDPEAAISGLVALMDDEIRAAINREQYVRLKQICYRIEIGILGIENSVAFGTLANRIGVYDNQRTHLHDKGLKIKLNARIACNEVRQQAEQEAIAALPTALQLVGKKGIGDFFVFKSNVRRTHRGKVDAARARSMDFQSLYEAPEVRRELQLSEAQTEAIERLDSQAQVVRREVMNNRRGAPPTREEMKKVQDASEQVINEIDELLTPEQVARVEQLIVRNAMHIEGYGALLDFAEEEAGTSLDQTLREKLLTELSVIEDRSAKTIETLKAHVEVDIAKELTPDQRTALTDAIGPYYEYTPMAIKVASPRVVYPD